MWWVTQRVASAQALARLGQGPALALHLGSASCPPPGQGLGWLVLPALCGIYPWHSLLGSSFWVQECINIFCLFKAVYLVTR